MKRVKQILFIAILCLLVCLTVCAAEDIEYSFENEQSMNGWSTTYLRYNFDPGYFNAYAYELSPNLSDPMLISPTIDINAEDYRYVVLTMKYSLDATWSKAGRVFFLVEGGTWNQENSVGSESFANTTEWDFVDIIFDMKTNEAWKGTISQIRVDPFDVPGSVSIKSIKLTNTLPEKETETENDDNKQDEKPKKETGVFLKVNSYDNDFADVETSAWYAKEVSGAYELGLIYGKTETLFAPRDGMTVAEAITLGARLNNAYGSADYEFVAAEEEPWYTPYVNYAINKGIIKADTFSEYNRRIKRGEMALVFANVLPAKEYNYINSVSSIPDVLKSSPYYSSVYKLYNAGIVVGNDGYGTFYPDSEITRAEASAIINRVASKELRISKNLITPPPAIDYNPFNMSSEAKYLMDDQKFYHSRLGGVPSGWDVVKTFDTPGKETRPSNTLVDNSAETQAYFSRELFDVNDGVLDFEFGVNIKSSNYSYIAFLDNDKSPVVQVMLRDGSYAVLAADGTYTDTGVKHVDGDVDFDLHINLDKRTFDLGIDGAYIGSYAVASDREISSFRYGATKEGWGTFTAYYALLTHNYLEVERFNNAPDNILPYGVQVISDGGKVQKVNLDTRFARGGTVALDSKANGKTGIQGKFEKASGNVVFETYVLLPTELNGAKIALKNGDAEVFSLSTKNGNFVAPDGKTVKYVTKNLWHIVRFEADTETGKVLVKVNGKNVGTYNFTNSSGIIDGYEITYVPSTESTMYVDEISSFIKLPYPEDYVPEPVIPNGDDYFVGLNVCSLWREGVHYGWEDITAYPEITPVLGYYDEGTPETSDWEIKMMTEHGIDYQIFCWYPEGNVTAPIQRTNMNQALIDGYFNARYSDKMQFAIMWENYNVKGLTFEDFKNYTVPYWIEYFFKDDRYVKIDNKPLLTLWQIDGKFSGCTAKEAFDYLREECKKAGFAGCEILLYSTNLDPAYKATLDTLGVDGLLAYHWGGDGDDVNVQASNLTKYCELDYTIPTISVGFDYVGWGDSKTRYGLLDPKDYPQLANIVKDTVAKRVASGNKYSNMVNISTWNEYGEGTYVMPTQRFGFGYLDAIREGFTKGDVAHNDVTTLTQVQRQRINYLFDQNRQLLRPQMLVENENTESVDPYEKATLIKKFTFENETLDNFTYWGMDDIKIENGIVSYTPTIKDPVFFWKSAYTEPISAKEANIIRIRAKITGDEDNYMTLFFKTNDGKDFSQDKALTANHVKNEWHDYYFDLRDVVTWKGKITNLRIDLTEYICDFVEMESVEFLYISDADVGGPFTLDINGGEVPLIKEPDTTGGGLMVPLHPESSILARMKCTYTWDKNTKLLTITNGAHTFAVTIGTDQAVIDGKATTLYAKTYMYDGLPVIPMDTLATTLGYFPVTHEDGNGVSIMLNSAADYEIIKTRERGKYEFNLDGDDEDWSPQGVAMSVKGGILSAVSTSSDPAIYSPQIYLKAQKYPKITVRMKWDRNSDKDDYACIYFTTANAGFFDTRRVDIQIPKSSNGEFVDLTFDMSKHLQWFDDIPSIRFDPFNSTGTFEIDYIRFEVDMEAEESERLMEEYLDNPKDSITNGDAQIPYFNPMISDNAVITIEESSPGSGDHYYNVKANSGNVWTYFTHKVKFEPSATYVVEFDARMTGLNSGEEQQGMKTGIYVNAMYDGGENRNHLVGAGMLEFTGFNEWVHYSAEITIGEECNNANDIISIYTDPIQSCGVNYQIDNFTMTKQ